MGDYDPGSSFVPALYKPATLLPIARHKQALLYTIETYPVTIVVASTGSGKTTQIPQYLLDGGWCSGSKMIAVTQPRRVAATTVAARVAEERSCKLGEEVGYSIRFEDLTSESTRIKFMTDGLLLREALVDPLLSRYSVIMVDEAHERCISTDILMGVLKKIMKRRADLRIVISSATIQAEDFLQLFSQNDGTNSTSTTKIVGLDGRTYPVDILHLTSPSEDYITESLNTVLAIHSSEPDGDILVFVPGLADIHDLHQKLSDARLDMPKQLQSLLILPLHAGLSSEQQLAVFDEAPEDTRKVILATNIAEASVTIDGIKYVVDTGFVKLRAYHPQTSISSLTAVPVSQASAQQRAGRAGRTAPGKCFRLYTETSFSQLPASAVPEIQRTDLAPVILQLKAVGIDNIVRFHFPTPPPSELVSRALELLHALGALDEFARLTKPLGVRMAELALEPMLGKALLNATSFGCLDEMISIAAMASVQGGVWHGGFDEDGNGEKSSRRKFAAEEGDHLTLLNIYTAYANITKGGKPGGKWCSTHGLDAKKMAKAVSIRGQLRRMLDRLGVVQEERHTTTGIQAKTDAIRKCLTSGYFAHAARMQPDGTFRSASGSDVVLYAHPTSLLFNRKAEWVIFHEIMETGAGKVFIRELTKIEKSWLADLGGGYYRMS